MLTHIPERIKEYNKGRIPGSLKLKYREMREDKFRFFRATTNLFFEDISKNKFLFKSPNVWLGGDLHIENFGSYKGDNGLAYFGINDFDECILGPCLLDIIRMCSCIYVAAEKWKITRQQTLYLVELFIDTYFKRLQKGYIRTIERDTARGIMKTFLDQVSHRKRADFIDLITVRKKGKLKFRDNNIRIAQLPKKEKELVKTTIHTWAKHHTHPDFYNVIDVVHRIAGCSSLGMKRYVALVEGNDEAGNYLLDIKETNKSCLREFVKVKQPAWKSEAERLIEVQQRVLSDPPALLSSIDIDKTNFVLKELQPVADRIDYNMFKGKLKKLKTIIENIASISAWGNLRSGGRQDSAIADDLIAFAQHTGKLKKELIHCASSYSKVITTYHASYIKAYDKGYFKI
jgi:uncharacterized protein (DUF2252 family)